MPGKSISWASPHFWGNEERYVMDALKSNWISGGEYVDRFEADFAQFCDVPYAVSVSNGTSALHAAFLALGLTSGDEIIVPGFGFMAAANVALHMGVIPVFSEVDADSWCMTASGLEKHISPQTKAIVPIHTYGNLCDMDSIIELAESYNLHVIEDAAEAFGSKYKGKLAGTIAPIGVFSFHATKTITTGEGGAVVTRNIHLQERMKLFRSHGMSAKRYWHDVPGHNFRLTNMQAAIGCAQLEHIKDIIRERERIYQTYVNNLKNIEGVILQHFNDDVYPVVWAVGVKLDASAFPQGRDMVIEQFRRVGIETRPGFYAASSMPHIYRVEKLPICESISEMIISLPSSPVLTDEEINFVCTKLKSFRK